MFFDMLQPNPGFSASSVGILDAITSSRVFHSEAGMALRRTASSKGLLAAMK